MSETLISDFIRQIVCRREQITVAIEWFMDGSTLQHIKLFTETEAHRQTNLTN